MHQGTCTSHRPGMTSLYYFIPTFRPWNGTDSDHANDCPARCTLCLTALKKCVIWLFQMSMKITGVGIAALERGEPSISLEAQESETDFGPAIPKSNGVPSFPWKNKKAPEMGCLFPRLAGNGWCRLFLFFLRSRRPIRKTDRLLKSQRRFAECLGIDVAA